VERFPEGHQVERGVMEPGVATAAGANGHVLADDGADPWAIDGATEAEVLTYLEPDQLVVDKAQPVPRATLGRGARALLWGLRVSGLILGGMVVYTFVVQVTG
jgi:hypothetical protein